MSSEGKITLPSLSNPTWWLSAKIEDEKLLRSSENGPKESMASLNFFIRLNVQPSIEVRVGDG